MPVNFGGRPLRDQELTTRQNYYRLSIQKPLFRRNDLDEGWRSQSRHPQGEAGHATIFVTSSLFVYIVWTIIGNARRRLRGRQMDVNDTREQDNN